MRKEIPAPLISVISEYVSEAETHATLDSLFMYADAPGDPPDESKGAKAQAWLRRTNKEADNPISVLGKILEKYFEDPDADKPKNSQNFFNTPEDNPLYLFVSKTQTLLHNYGYEYRIGGFISDGTSAPTRSLEVIIRGRNMPAIHAEFDRALENVVKDPREAVSAACNILESVFKTYIADEQLTMPSKQDLRGVWKVVRDDLKFDPTLVQDDDLKKILTGLLSTVDGIGALRTHASAAHGEGRKQYNLKPRHARLAIHSAHTLVAFVIETWDERKATS
jgi:hypothetical protein